MEVRGLSLFFCALLLRRERDGRRCPGTGTENEISGGEGNGKAHLASENRRKVTNPRENGLLVRPVHDTSLTIQHH